jgi:putative Holliday junction resolvase
VPVIWWDERLSTAQAQRTLIAHNVRRNKRRETIDKVAAALILQSYMDAQSSGLLPPEECTP